MGILDLFTGILLAFLIWVVAIFYGNRKFKTEREIRTVFIQSITFKLVASILFGCLYQYYYRYGDSINYHMASKEFFAYVYNHPNSFFDFIFLNQNKLRELYPDFLTNSKMVSDYFIDSNIMVQRFVFYLGPFVYFLYFPITVLFSLFSFIGCWKISRSLSNIYPTFQRKIQIAFLFLPSVIFWTAGIGKDAICIGFINIFASIIIDKVILKKGNFFHLSLAFILLYIVFVIKSYIVASFLPFIIYYLFSYKIKLIQQTGKRFLVKSLFLTLLITASLGILIGTQLVNKVGEEIISGALSLSKGQQDTDFGNESKYDLGITIQDIQNKNVTPFILPSIEVAFFRPYLWEVKKPIIVFSFLESCFFLLFTIWVFLKGFMFRTAKVILQNEFILFAFAYSIVFAFFVGLVSLNFGTLIRYKTPFLSYFLVGLFMLNEKLNQYKKENSNQLISS